MGEGSSHAELGGRHAPMRTPHVPECNFTKLYLSNTRKKTPAPNLLLTGNIA
jgi:hypothetical protein